MSNPTAAWGGLVFLITLSTFLAFLIARELPWQTRCNGELLVVPTALALGPFILGICSVLIGLMTEGVSLQVQVSIIAAVMASVGGLFLKFSKTLKNSGSSGMRWLPASGGERTLLFVLLICAADILYLAIRLPLTENDALEYGLVGRAIFEARTLSVYPLLNADSVASGFFAPWTHPPLYPSLVALTYGLQDTASQADLMKTIAPWFTLGAASGLVGLGRLHSPRMGWLAAILFLTIPLLGVGAQTSAIDALPVAGMVLLLIALVGIDRSRRGAALAIGSLLGLALWTHSQAILYAPILVVAMVVTGGVSEWRASTVLAFKSLLIAAVFASYPYLRNIAIYGTPISDNPAVFALGGLDWDGFFRYARSIYDWSTRLQYGVLKGFLAVHSYGFAFWVAIVGAIYQLTVVLTPAKNWRVLFNVSAQPLGAVVPLIAFHVLAIYFGGVVASLVVGTDLMIKNDRYLLVIAPAVGLLGAWACIELLYARWSQNVRDRAKSKLFVQAGVCILLFGHACAFLLYGNLMQWLQLVDVTWHKSDPAQTLPDLPPVIAMKADPLLGWGGIQMVRQLSKEVPSDARILAMRPADFYYSDRRMLSYLDPRTVPLYEQAPTKLVDSLQRLGVNYVQVPDYLIPPVSNSSVMGLLSDPELTELIVDANFNQLYRLRLSEERTEQTRRISISQDLFDWDWVEYPRLGVGGPAFALRGMGKGRVTMPSSFFSTTSILPRSYSHMLLVGLTTSGSQLTGPIPVKSGKEYVLKLDVEGEGFFRIWVWKGKEPVTDPASWLQTLAGDFALSSKTSHLAFSRRMRIDGEVSGVRIGIERYGVSRLTVKSATLVELDSE